MIEEKNRSQQLVVPGQYITPLYKLNDGITSQYIPGKGTIISNIEIPNESNNNNKNGNNRVLPIIVSTILGTVYIKEITSITSDDDKMKDDDGVAEGNNDGDKKKIVKHIVSVIPKGSTSFVNFHEDIIDNDNNKISINLPKENDIVLVRITKISNIQAYCEIISLENKPILSDSGIGSNGSISHNSLPQGGGSQHLFNLQTIASSQSNLSNFQIYDIGENFKGIIRINDIRSTERDKLKIIDCFKPGDIVRAIIISLGDGSNYYLSTARNDLGVVFAKSENGAGGLMYPLDWQNMIDLETGLIEKRKNANPFI